jgi:hypothetical protein
MEDLLLNSFTERTVLCVERRREGGRERIKVKVD